MVNEYNGIRYTITDSGVCIFDSWSITDDSLKEDFLMYICLENEGLELCRSRKSMFIEWKAHNIMYQKHILRSRTGNTDVEFNQRKFIAWFYRVICKLFKEKCII